MSADNFSYSSRALKYIQEAEARHQQQMRESSKDETKYYFTIKPADSQQALKQSITNPHNNSGPSQAIPASNERLSGVQRYAQMSKSPQNQTSYHSRHSPELQERQHSHTGKGAFFNKQEFRRYDLGSFKVRERSSQRPSFFEESTSVGQTARSRNGYDNSNSRSALKRINIFDQQSQSRVGNQGNLDQRSRPSLTHANNNNKSYSKLNMQHYPFQEGERSSSTFRIKRDNSQKQPKNRHNQYEEYEGSQLELMVSKENTQHYPSTSNNQVSSNHFEFEKFRPSHTSNHGDYMEMLASRSNYNERVSSKQLEHSLPFSPNLKPINLQKQQQHLQQQQQQQQQQYEGDYSQLQYSQHQPLQLAGEVGHSSQPIDKNSQYIQLQQQQQQVPSSYNMEGYSNQDDPPTASGHFSPNQRSGNGFLPLQQINGNYRHQKKSQHRSRKQINVPILQQIIPLNTQQENVETQNSGKASKDYQQYKNFFYPSYLTRNGKENSSIISSKSYENMEGGKENCNTGNSGRKNFGRTLTNLDKMGRMSTQPRTSCIPKISKASKKKKSRSKTPKNLFFDFTHTSRTPDLTGKYSQMRDSSTGRDTSCRHSFMRMTEGTNAGNSKSNAFAMMSPDVSGRKPPRNRNLDRSDMSIKSRISNNSYLGNNRRDVSANQMIKGLPCDSKLKNMSRTWVKSHLLDSREDISTIKYKRVSNNKTNGSFSSNKFVGCTKKATEEIENLFRTDHLRSTHNEQAKDYELSTMIGQGAYAKVYKAVHKPTDTRVAIKLYEKSKLKDKLRQKSIKREIKILSRVQHPNIVNFIDCFATKNHIYLVMELVDGCSLYELLKKQDKRKIGEDKAKKIIKQVLKALYYCHSRNVTHRDIKLENVIITEDGLVKIIDFGFSTCIPIEKKVRMFCGTPSYMAPEIVKKVEYRGPPVDIWATGVLFYVLLSGKFPFRGSTDKKLYHRISYSEIKFNPEISKEVCDIISKMMAKEADYRPTAKRLLKHVFKKKGKPSRGSNVLPKSRETSRDVSRSSNVLQELTLNGGRHPKSTRGPSTPLGNSRGGNYSGSNSQFNNLLARMDKENRQRREKLESLKNSRTGGDPSLQYTQKRLLSKYLDGSKVAVESMRAMSPQTLRAQAGAGKGSSRGLGVSRGGYAERGVSSGAMMLTDRNFGSYFKGDFSKFLERGRRGQEL